MSSLSALYLHNNGILFPVKDVRIYVTGADEPLVSDTQIMPWCTLKLKYGKYKPEITIAQHLYISWTEWYFFKKNNTYRLLDCITSSTACSVYIPYVVWAGDYYTEIVIVNSGTDYLFDMCIVYKSTGKVFCQLYDMDSETIQKVKLDGKSIPFIRYHSKEKFELVWKSSLLWKNGLPLEPKENRIPFTPYDYDEGSFVGTYPK